MTIEIRVEKQLWLTLKDYCTTRYAKDIKTSVYWDVTLV
jgi:hypothetical protein